MSFSKTKIFNIALSNLGVSAPIQSSIQDNPTAILMNNYYDLARDTVLEAHEWSFATAYMNLTLSTETPLDTNFQFAFNYPTECIAPRAVIDCGDNREKRFEIGIDSTGAKVILTNSNPCVLRYTKRVTNETYFSAPFVNALCFYLAYLSAQVVNGSTNKKNSNLQDYNLAIKQAIVTDARKNIEYSQDNRDYTDFR